MNELPTGALVVIVLNWNGEPDTLECLRSLATDTSAPCTILLVDSASADGSGQRLHRQFPDLPYLQTESNLGYAGGNNTGIAWALEHGATHIMVLNNDTVVHPGTLGRLQAALDLVPRLGAVSPTIGRYDAPDDLWFAGGHFSMARALGVHHLHVPPPGNAASLPCTFLTGCCILFRADALRQVGAFRQDFFAYVEDAELCLRLRRAGWTLGWVPGARILHKVPRRGTSDTPFKIEMRDRNRRRIVRDLYSGMQQLRFHLWFWPTRLALAARYAMAGDGPRLRALWAGSRAR